jgi:hypothetical protein
MTEEQAKTAVRVWANVCLEGEPEEVARGAADHAALERACRQSGVRFAREALLVDGHVDAYAEGSAGEVAPMLRRLGSAGHSYAVDVGDETALDAVVDACGDGVAYACHQVF